MGMDRLKGTLGKLAEISEGMKTINSAKVFPPQNYLLPDVSQIPDLSRIKVDYENSVGQKMDRHIALLEEQNEQLQRQNRQLQEQYEFMRQESIDSKEQARKSRLFGWWSLTIATLISLISLFVQIS